MLSLKPSISSTMSGGFVARRFHHRPGNMARPDSVTGGYGGPVNPPEGEMTTKG